MSNPPGVRPVIPHFSSGPCAKRPGWSLQALTDAVLGRSHRSKIGKAKLKRAIDLTREVLEAPADYRIGIVPASDTGAVEMALWSLLGPRPVTMLAWESFGEGWVSDVQKELKLKDVTVLKAPYGELPDLVQGRSRRPTWCSPGTARPPARASPTPTGSRPTAQGLTICDATSAAFAQKLDWAQARCRDLLLAEGARRRGRARHDRAVAARGRAARELHAALAAAEDFPHDQGRQAQRGDLRGRHHQHAVDALRRGLSRHAQLGQIDRRAQRADRRAPTPTPAAIADWVARTPWIDFLASDPAIRSNTSVCLKVVDPAVLKLPADAQAKFVKGIAAALEKEGIAYDIDAYRDAPSGLRIWCGATVERADVEALTLWLDWAYAEAKAALPKAA